MKTSVYTNDNEISYDVVDIANSIANAVRDIVKEAERKHNASALLGVTQQPEEIGGGATVHLYFPKGDGYLDPVKVSEALEELNTGGDFSVSITSMHGAGYECPSIWLHARNKEGKKDV